MSYNPSEVIYKRELSTTYAGITVDIPTDCQKVIIDVWDSGGAQQITNNQIRLRVNTDSGNNYSYALRYVTAASGYLYTNATATSWPLVLFGKTGTPPANCRVILYPRNDAARYANGEVKYGFANTAGDTYNVSGYYRWLNTTDDITRIVLMQTVVNWMAFGMMVRAIK